MRAKWLWGLVATVAVAGLAHADVVTSPATARPVNFSISVALLKNYYNSGRYLADIKRVDERAQRYLLGHDKGSKLAIVLDIDETAISNWQEMVANHFAYFRQGPCRTAGERVIGPCGALAWDRLERAPALGPTLAVFKLARAHGITVFFITGRHAAERAVTRRMLIKDGYLGWKPQHLLMEPDTMKVPSAADFKAPERKWIEKTLGYTIIANIGDQWSDLAGGYAKRDFKLPDPFYYIP